MTYLKDSYKVTFNFKKELDKSITDINHYNEEVMMYLNTLENGKAKIEIQLDEQR